MKTKIIPSRGFKKKGVCPICKSASLAPHAPFCSLRCAQLDLGKWLNQDYVIPSHEFDDNTDLEKLTKQIDKAP